MGPDQRRLERQSSMPSERPKSNYGNYPMRYFKISAYGALPQAGIASGLWPFRTYTHPISEGQRPEPIPDRSNAPGMQGPPHQQGPKARPIPAFHIKPKQSGKILSGYPDVLAQHGH